MGRCRFNKKGQIEAKREAGLLLKESQFKFDLVLTSYLRRSINTCKICLKELNNDDVIVNSSWRLNERHYGNLQGLNKAETAENMEMNKCKSGGEAIILLPLQ